MAYTCNVEVRVTENSSDDQTQLDELVFAYLERVESDADDGSRALEQLCAEHPALAPELRRRVAMLVGSGLWTPTPANADDMPEKLGEFRLVRRLGRGGMGVVFLAEQTSVGRQVALKLIKPDQLFVSGTRARFLREAQAIARLDHSGIVKVLTVGEESGVPYFAMEYVAGVPFDVLIDAWRRIAPDGLRGADVRAELASHLNADDRACEWNEAFFERGWVEIVLRSIRDVARALHHAHQRGVLHRDVKPSNLLLCPDGRVRLLDFGLASLATSQAITRTGTQLGSVTYMSPEQLDGRTKDLGPAVDVYGLGVTLYELLGLQLPYPGQSYEEVRRRVLDAQPRPLRSLNPNVSIDVETVCAKAMERDAARRYGSAEEFARDLDNILELRPIQARPPSSVRRVVRWTQRRPASATALALGALLLIAGPLGYEVHRWRAADELRVAYERSERDFRSALSAIRHVLREMSVEGFEDVPRMQLARLAAIDRALELFEALAPQRPDDLELLFEGGELHKSRGEVLRDLGRPEEAFAEFERSITFHRRVGVLDVSPVRSTYLAAALVSAGKSRSAIAAPADALRYFTEADALMENASRTRPEHAEWRVKRANVQLAQAEAYRILGDAPSSRASANRALELALDARKVEDGALASWTAARAYDELATLSRDEGDASGALDRAHLAHESYAAASAFEPGSRFYAFDVSTGLQSIAISASQLGEFEEAESAAREGLEVLERLLRDFPESERYARHRLDLLDVLATNFGAQGRHDETRAILSDIVEARRALFALHPDRCDLGAGFAESAANLALALVLAASDGDRALGLLDEGERALASCSERSLPPAYLMRLGDAIAYNRALALCHLDRRDEARERVERFSSDARLEPMPQRMSADLWAEFMLCLDRLGEADAERGELTDRMFAALERAITAGYDDVGELRANPALDPYREDPRFTQLLARIPSTKD